MANLRCEVSHGLPEKDRHRVLARHISNKRQPYRALPSRVLHSFRRNEDDSYSVCYRFVLAVQVCRLRSVMQV